jgi:hypothetical protein
MNKIKIWRVEDDSGLGCYRKYGIKFLDKLVDRHDRTCLKHPTPFNDKGIEREILTIEICGFVNKSQAIQWFSKYELKKLAGLGFNLKEIEVAEITAIGEKQVLAIR